MSDSLYRTDATTLSEDELPILDVMFGSSVTCPMLRKSRFASQFNSRSHSLDDAALGATLSRMRRSGLIQLTGFRFRGHRRLAITPKGGETWTAERCPVWDRYCTERYPAVIRGRTIMSVSAVSGLIRDDFLWLWPPVPARCERAAIRDIGLIDWHPFRILHVGLSAFQTPAAEDLSYQANRRWDAYLLQHVQYVEQHRTWWRCVRELQKFLPSAEE